MFAAMLAQMLALTLDDAKTIAVVAAAALVAGAVVALWAMKTVLQKVMTALVLAVLAFAVWTQRQSLVDCADKVQASYDRIGTDVTLADTDCSFFGLTISISDPRDEPAAG